jgi:flagellar hook-associated protein 3 FlgL
LTAIDQYSTNITKANTWVQFTNTALTGMSDILSQASTLVNSINSGSSDPALRQSARNQLIDLKKQLVDMGNVQMGDQYIFGGAKSDTPPFNYTTSDYSGDSTQLTIDIAQNTTQAVSQTGDRILKGTSTPAGSLPDYGSTDILATFDNLIAAVGDMTTPSDTAALVQGASDLHAGSAQVINAISDNISRLTRLDSMAKLNANNVSTMQQIFDSLQNVDYAQLGVELNNQKTAFEASLSTTATISQLSLLNYM